MRSDLSGDAVIRLVYIFFPLFFNDQIGFVVGYFLHLLLCTVVVRIKMFSLHWHSYHFKTIQEGDYSIFKAISVRDFLQKTLPW